MTIIEASGFIVCREDIEHLIDPSPVFDLNIGDKVSQIGRPAKSGKITSSHRVDCFDPPLEYVGRVNLIFPRTTNEECQCVLFKIPPGGITRKKKRLPGDFYIPYIILDDDTLFRSHQGRRGSAGRPFDAVFTKA